jgi:ribosomal protein S18 acetylase RimI-like enzyme
VIDPPISTHGPQDWPSDGFDAVDQGLGDFNDAAAPLHEVQKLACIARDAAGRVLGGATGRTWGEVAELQMLWVDTTRRRQGLGARLVGQFETAARARGCTLVTLETFSFQAPAFYRALGYTAVHTNTHFPHGLVKYLMEKHLGPAGA